MSFDMKNVDFWLNYMMDHWFKHDNLHTWDWAFVVLHDGEVVVRNGPLWEHTGIYCNRRIMRGCEWE